MSMIQNLFYLFSGISILSALMVILSKNPIRAVLCLILTFFTTAGIWMLLEAEFLSVILVLVYVGAIMVLFLFVIMMLDIELAIIKEGFAQYLPLGVCISVLVVISLAYVVGNKNFGLEQFPIPLPHPKSYSNTLALGVLLYSKYLYPFLLAGILLLVAIIAAISLVFRGNQGRKKSIPASQVRIRKEDRIQLIKLSQNVEEGVTK